MEKWNEEKQRENDEGIKSNFITAASSINQVYIQFRGGYCPIRQ